MFLELAANAPILINKTRGEADSLWPPGPHTHGCKGVKKINQWSARCALRSHAWESVRGPALDADGRALCL